LRDWLLPHTGGSINENRFTGKASIYIFPKSASVFQVLTINDKDVFPPPEAGKHLLKYIFIGTLEKVSNL